MTFEGTVSDINAALNGLSYTPTSGYTGAASLQIVSNDLGLSGSGGSQTDVDTIAITVLPVYSTNDYSKLQTFLSQPSAVSGQSNGQRINAAYNPLDPATWTGVAWSSAEPKRVLSIGASGEWYSKSLAGPLDLSGLSQMTYLLVTQNQLTSLNVSGASALETIFCFDNRLTSLTLSGNTSLANIYGSSNRLTTLDLSGAPNLIGIQCNSNMLTALDVTANVALRNLYCGNNQLESLDVSHNALLSQLYCEQNRLTQLDVRSNPALTELGVGYNQLTALDVSANSLLMMLACNDNELAALDIRNNTALTQLGCYGNELAALDISRNTALGSLNCYDNQLTSLNFAANPAVTSIDCRENRLTSLDLRMLTALSELNCSDNLLTSIQAVYSGGNISVAANGRGYVELRLYHPFHGDAPQVTAVAEAGVPFIRWTESGTEVSAAEIYELEAGQDYLLTAHFLSLSSTAENRSAYTGGRFTLTPSVDGGTWDWDEEYFSATFNSPATFTALKAGTSTITYTVEGASVTYDVTIEASTLPSTGQSFAWVWALGGAAALAVILAVGIISGIRKREKTNTPS
jgi:LPXTG-motif cell wall-anchored protein